MAIDPIIKDHQLWIGFVQPEGLVVSPHALKNAQAVLSHNVGVQQEILRRHTVPDFHGNLRLKNFPAFTKEVWGWRESDLATPPDDLSARLPEYGETLQPTWVVRGGKGQPEYLILVEELPWGTDFDKAVQQSEEHRWHASPQARFERLLRETGVSIGLLVSPGQIRLVYAPKGESSGHVTFPIHQMAMAANWPMLAALHLLLHSDRLFIGPENQRLPAVLEASRRYQNEVSIRLAGQVLRALNELVRGFQEADRAAHGRILGEALRHDPNHIYGGMLTTLMRMVFVLYAEDRSLMGSDETWLQNYSISGLYERLRADAGQYPDTMDSRYGAWAQIITLTRLLYDGGGHGSWRLPPRHGGLFDPDAFPFLEGRLWESKRAARALIEPPLVSDGILFRILQDLLYLEGERISYRALDVEQIGSVYEAMMGFTVETAHGISIGLGSDHLVVNLEDLLTKKPADRPKWLKENADCEVTGKATEQLKFAASVDELLAALRRRLSKLYLDQNSNPVTVPSGGIYLQPTEERRRSGSHYTPRSLTQPIVKTTLDPVLAQLGDNPTPEQILALKVCDPAMGSGAFLVETCRYLGEKLEKAWIAHGQTPPIPADQDPLLHARRMVAQRCLYGVDKNPFAVDLAKLSLWLATFAKDHPFTFVDHTLRSGDSLVGLTAHQIEAFHWQPKEEGALLRGLPSRLRHILNARAQILDAADETPYETLSQKLAVTDEQMIDLRLAGDLAVAAFFAGNTATQREVRRKELAEKLRRSQERAIDLELEEDLQRTVFGLKRGAKGITPFHWDLEFPEVFRPDDNGNRSAGFDAFVGNPPFAGKNTISKGHAKGYLGWLKLVHEESHGNADLSAHFYRRAFDLLQTMGRFGLIATNTIGQGDTRSTGLRWICSHTGTIYAARKRYKWPGREAAVTVSIVHVCKGPLGGPFDLNGREVGLITAYLFHVGDNADPCLLKANNGLAFKGCEIGSLGYLLTPDQPEFAEFSLVNDPRDSQRKLLKPYIGGSDLVEGVTRRYVLDVDGLSEQAIKSMPRVYQYLEQAVRADFLSRGEVREDTVEWWHFRRPSLALRRSLGTLPKMLVLCRVSEAAAFTFVSGDSIANSDIICFRFSDFASYCVLQSSIHEIWARMMASTLEDRLRYTPSDSFGTFPLPENYQADPLLAAAGQAYLDRRTQLGAQHSEGLTDIYNRFHDPQEVNPQIVHLRELHDAMNRAVLDAYKWFDIQARCQFLAEANDDDDEGDGRSKLCKYRYRWADEIHDLIFVRLLLLNRARAEQEVQSLDTASTAQTSTRVSKRPAKRSIASTQATLSYEETTE